jgi:hypothetical protein
MMTSLKCRCGQRICRRDVMQRGFLKREPGPIFVYVKYRCSRCKKLGEHLVRQEEWESALIQEKNSEMTPAERKLFDQLGQITFSEMRKFHHALEKLERIPNLLVEEPE